MADDLSPIPPPSSTPTPTPTPTPVAAVPAPAAALPVKPYAGLALTSWILIVLTGLLAIIPVIGFASWVIAFAVIPLTLVFAIIILTRGGTAQGIFLIIISVVILPTFLFLAPVVSTLVLGASVSARETAQETAIKSNLRKIETAKDEYAIDTSAASGATVTMAQLTKYLGGNQIKPVVGETYEPRAVGESAAAKLPEGKSLAGHKAGGEITMGSSTTTSSTTTSSADESPSPSASADEE